MQSYVYVDILYLSVDEGGVIKDFMADYEGLRSCCKRKS